MAINHVHSDEIHPSSLRQQERSHYPDNASVARRGLEQCDLFPAFLSQSQDNRRISFLIGMTLKQDSLGSEKAMYMIKCFENNIRWHGLKLITCYAIHKNVCSTWLLIHGECISDKTSINVYFTSCFSVPPPPPHPHHPAPPFVSIVKRTVRLVS